MFADAHLVTYENRVGKMLKRTSPGKRFLSDRRARSTAALSAPVFACSFPGQRLVITYYLKNKLEA